MSSFTFNTKVVFLLGKLLKYFESEIDSVVEIVQLAESLQPGQDVSEVLPSDKIISLFIKAAGSASEAEQVAMEVLAVATRRSIKEVQEMDGYQFISEFREFLLSIDWKRLLGESLGLTLSKNEDLSVAR